MTEMTAGRLRHEVTWFKPTRTRKSGGGQSKEGFERVGSSAACVEPAGRGGEFATHDQVVAIRSHVITIRDEPSWMPVAAGWRCEWAGLTLNVNKVDILRTDANTCWRVISCLEQAPVD